MVGLSPPTAWLAASGATVAVAVPGMASPYMATLPYRGWNWTARKVAEKVSRYVSAICFATIVLAASRTQSSSRFVAASDAPSMWSVRETQSGGAYFSQYHQPLLEASRDGWVRSVRTWSKQSGCGWAVGLVPFLALLRLLDVQHTSKGSPTAARGIYTLY